MHRKPFATRAEARAAIFEYIEVWFNRRRKHSALGYLAPNAYEQLIVQGNLKGGSVETIRDFSVLVYFLYFWIDGCAC